MQFVDVTYVGKEYCRGIHFDIIRLLNDDHDNNHHRSGDDDYQHHDQYGDEEDGVDGVECPSFNGHQAYYEIPNNCRLKK